MDIFKDLTDLENSCFDANYTRCEFDDECSFCDNPEHGSYAIGYDEYNNEVDDYICGKCAVKSIPELMKRYADEYESLLKYNYLLKDE